MTSDFGSIDSLKKKKNCIALQFVLKSTQSQVLELCFSVSKKVGKAVVRNKVKRRMSAIIHKNLKNMNRGFNLIFIAKPEIASVSFTDLEKDGWEIDASSYDYDGYHATKGVTEIHFYSWESVFKVWVFKK